MYNKVYSKQLEFQEDEVWLILFSAPTHLSQMSMLVSITWKEVDAPLNIEGGFSFFLSPTEDEPFLLL